MLIGQQDSKHLRERCLTKCWVLVTCLPVSFSRILRSSFHNQVDKKKYFTLNLWYSHQCCYEYHLLFVLGFIMMTSEVQNFLFQDMFMHASSHSTWYLKCNNVFVVALVTTCSHNVQWCHMPLPILNNLLLWISF